MAFPTSISSGHFSAIAVSNNAVPTTLNETNLKACFEADTDFVRIPDVRDFPQLGTPPSTVKVPVYGQAQTVSVTTQSDAPDLELTINWVPSVWAPTSGGGAFATTDNLGDAVGDGIAKVFQVAILTARNDLLHTGTAPNVGGSVTAPVENALMYFVGKLDSILYTPARDDAMTATVSMTIQSEFFGPYTVDAV